MTSEPKTVSLLKEIKMIRDRNFKNQIFTACILEFVFSDCLVKETIIDNCDKLCSVERHCVEWWPCNADFYLSEESV